MKRSLRQEDLAMADMKPKSSISTRKLLMVSFGLVVPIVFIIAIILFWESSGVEKPRTVAKQEHRTDRAQFEPRRPAIEIPSAPLATYTGTIRSAKAHAAGIKSFLDKKGFYSSNSRQKKVIALNTMVEIEGYGYEEVEQQGEGVSVFTNFYYSKGIAYQFGVRYGSSGLMELVTFQILYQDTDSGAIMLTETIM